MSIINIISTLINNLFYNSLRRRWINFFVPKTILINKNYLTILFAFCDIVRAGVSTLKLITLIFGTRKKKKNFLGIK